MKNYLIFENGKAKYRTSSKNEFIGMCRWYIMKRIHGEWDERANKNMSYQEYREIQNRIKVPLTFIKNKEAHFAKYTPPTYEENKALREFAEGREYNPS